MAFILKKIIGFVHQPFLWLIVLYQKIFSPDHGLFKIFFPYGYCRFRPTCSEYAYGAIKKRGLIIGFIKAAWRILRCNPWNRGGEDYP